jgi:hypothetical protein
MRITASAVSLNVEDVLASSDFLIEQFGLKGCICLAGGSRNDR